MLSYQEQNVINHALAIIEGKLKREEDAVFTSPDMVKSYVAMKYSMCEREVFSILFLDAQHKMIKCDELFFGTIDAAAVYPREVVKAALKVNASAVILVHNHPSGESEPSRADRNITERLKAALELVEIRTLDHLVVGGTSAFSFAEAGWL